MEIRPADADEQRKRERSRPVLEHVKQEGEQQIRKNVRADGLTAEREEDEDGRRRGRREESLHSVASPVSEELVRHEKRREECDEAHRDEPVVARNRVDRESHELEAVVVVDVIARRQERPPSGRCRDPAVLPHPAPGVQVIPEVGIEWGDGPAAEEPDRADHEDRAIESMQRTRVEGDPHRGHYRARYGWWRWRASDIFPGPMANKVPLLDIKAQQAPILDEMRRAIDAVLDSQQYILGPAVTSFEKAAATYLGLPGSVGVANGSDAIVLALQARDVKAGDEVVTTPFTFFATAGAISRLGARAVFADIDEKTFNLDPKAAVAAITPKTKAILPVHLFGRCAEVEPLVAAAKPKGITVIEDAAQSIGAERKGRKAGQLGDGATYSFFPSKNLGGVGDGGLVAGLDTGFMDRVRKLRVHGGAKTYFHEEVGMNSRLDSIQAAVLEVKLKRLDAWTDARRKNAAKYRELLKDVAEIRLPADDPDGRHIYNQFTILADRRDALKEHLTAEGIGNAIYYPLCLHQQQCFASWGYRKGQFPIAEKCADRVLSIPIYGELTEAQLEQVAGAIRGFYRGAARKVTSASG